MNKEKVSAAKEQQQQQRQQAAPTSTSWVCSSHVLVEVADFGAANLALHSTGLLQPPSLSEEDRQTIIIHCLHGLTRNTLH